MFCNAILFEVYHRVMLQEKTKQKHPPKKKPTKQTPNNKLPTLQIIHPADLVQQLS